MYRPPGTRAGGASAPAPRPYGLQTWVSERFKRSRQHQPEAQRHIVFDMDETLVHTFDDPASLGALRLFSAPRFLALRPRLYVVMDGIWGVTRPHLEEMMRACFEEFSTVTVWSAGEADYVAAVTRRIFRGLPRPDLVMTRDDCTTGEEGDAAADDIYKKPLRVAREYYEQLGRLDVWMDASNTLIVEDRPSAISSEDRFNSVLVPPYTPEPTGAAMLRDDLALKALAGWVSQDSFRQAADVRQIPRPAFYSVPLPSGVVRAAYVARRPITVSVSV